MRRLISLLITIIAFATLSAETSYIKLVEKADKAIAAGDYAAAINYLTSALKQEPDNSGNVMLLSNIGMLQFYTGQDSLAIISLSIAHDMAPESVTILTNRAKVFTENGLYTAALNDLDKIIALDSTLYNPHLQKSAIFLARGELEVAAAELDIVQRMINVDQSLEASAALAWLATLRNDNEEALKRYSTLIKLAPSADFYASRALCYIAKEDYPEASEDIAEGLKLDECCAELYVARAALNKRMYRNDDSLRDAQKAIELGADRARLREMLNL